MTAPATVSAHDLVHVKHEEGGVAVVTFSRAETMNSLDPKTMWHVRHTVLALLEDPRVRALVLTGSGKAFCAGANVKDMQEAAQQGRAVQWVLDTTAELHPLLLELHASAKPLVAAMNGVAAGGGLGLALVADCRIGSPDARFAAGYFGLGLSPDGGSTWLMPRLVGEQRTRQFFFGNEVMPAETAFELGLLDEVVPAAELVARAVAVARQWGSWAARSRESTKRLLESQSTTSFAEQLEAERGLIAAAAGTTDFKEGTTAFTEKRKARFA
jgi:2-(1,2-epoxy-1,2-dihydrophenyl)acetyl-CoA isomerase